MLGSFLQTHAYIPQGIYPLGSIHTEKPTLEAVKTGPILARKTPVTIGEFDKFIQEGDFKDHLSNEPLYRSYWKQYLQSQLPPEKIKELPRTNITEEQLRKFIDWKKEKTGLNHRLPTREEWEVLAQGETINLWDLVKNARTMHEIAQAIQKLAFHNFDAYYQILPNDQINFFTDYETLFDVLMQGLEILCKRRFATQSGALQEPINHKSFGFEYPTPVNQLAPNTFDLFGLTGGVWEAVTDNQKLLLKGGAFFIDEVSRLTNHHHEETNTLCRFDIGVRLVADIEQMELEV